MRFIGVIPVLVLAVLAGWILTYPSTNDPKNIKYVLWKAGWYNLNLDEAVETMIGDAHRRELVIGKTEHQLESRFGSLLLPAAASEYLRGCYQTSSWNGKKVLFIRTSPWMVVFDGDRATELVLIKGC